MSAFCEVKLGDVLTFQRGFDITKSEQTEGDVPIVSSSGISSFHNEFRVSGPGVVIGRKGSLGTVHFVQRNYWPHDTTLWVKDFKNNDPRFLSYFLGTLHLENFDVGASNPTLNRNHLHKIKVLFPRTRNHQRKIAAILAAYDELIESNKRRISILDRVAEEIYREWFVRLRFPGRQHVKFTKGIPTSWKVRPLRDIANFTMGQSPPSTSYNDAGEGLPFHQGVGTYGYRFPRNVTFCNAKGRKARKGDTLFSVRAPVGRLNVANCEMIIGRGLAAIRHKEACNSFLHYLLKVAFANEDIIGNGSIFNSVGKDELAKFPVLEPENSLVKQFEVVARRIDEQIEILNKSEETLSRIRKDLLLRLISGRLSVDELEVLSPPSMTESLPINATAARDA